MAYCAFVYELFFLLSIIIHRVFIGIKKLLALVDMVRQTEQEYRVVKFLSKMEEEGALDTGSTIHN